jgi:hypothetical protein
MRAIVENNIVATEGKSSVVFYNLFILWELSRGLRRVSAAAGLLGLRVRIPPGRECLL